MKITKLQSSGSDHLVLINPENEGLTNIDWPKAAVDLCSRSGPFGADGLVIVRFSSGAPNDLTIEAFTPDGNSPNLCINGVLCGTSAVAWNLQASQRFDIQISEKQYHSAGNIMENGNLLQSRFGSYTIRQVQISSLLKVPESQLMQNFEEIGISASNICFFDVGTPQLHFSAQHIDEAKLAELGKRLNHPSFSRDGINVSAVAIGGDIVLTRTFERGGGGLTYSCASAASCSAAMAISILRPHNGVVPVITKGGEYKIGVSHQAGRFHVSEIEGIVSPVYSSSVSREYLSELGSASRKAGTISGHLHIESISLHDQLVTNTLRKVKFEDWCKLL